MSIESDDQYMERTPDLVARVRKLREAAELEMNKFTRVADYDVRRVVGQKPKALAFSGEDTSPSQAGEKAEAPAAKPSPAPAEHGDQREDE